MMLYHNFIRSCNQKSPARGNGAYHAPARGIALPITLEEVRLWCDTLGDANFNDATAIEESSV